jgi:hypothetical protein
MTWLRPVDRTSGNVDPRRRYTVVLGPSTSLPTLFPSSTGSRLSPSSTLLSLCGARSSG